MRSLRINADRLQNNIRELGMFGLNEETRGLDRTTFTEAELAARQWLKSKLLALQLKVRVDEAANIWATRRGAGQGMHPESRMLWNIQRFPEIQRFQEIWLEWRVQILQEIPQLPVASAFPAEHIAAFPSSHSAHISIRSRTAVNMTVR